MKNTAIALFASFLLASCGGENSSSESTDSANKKEHVAAEAKRAVENSDIRVVEEDGKRTVQVEGKTYAEIDESAFAPAFTRETVIKLNAIVQRSLDVYKEFSPELKSINAAVDTAMAEDASADDRATAEAGYDKIVAWHDRALAAQADMTDAVEVLKASDEIYNEELLAGMIKYVNDIEGEMKKRRRSIEERLGISA